LPSWKCQRSAEVLAMRTIRSPLSGIVVEVVLKPGEFSSSNLKETDPQAGGSRSPARRSDTAVTMYGKIKNGQHAQYFPSSRSAGATTHRESRRSA